MMVDVLCQELPLIETGRSSPKPRKPPVAAATTHFPLVSRTSPQHIAPEAVFVFLVMLKYVEICWDFDFVFQSFSVLRFLPFFVSCSVLISPPPWGRKKCFQCVPRRAPHYDRAESHTTLGRGSNSPSTSSSGPVSLGLHGRRTGHGAHGVQMGAGYGVQGPFCLNSEGVGTILNAANMLQLVFSDALHSRSMDEVTRSPACYSLSPGVFKAKFCARLQLHPTARLIFLEHFLWPRNFQNIPWHEISYKYIKFNEFQWHKMFTADFTVPGESPVDKVMPLSQSLMRF